LRQLAADRGAALRISGATAAALPTIDLFEVSLRGARVLRLEGVLNATTNFLLNAMMARGCTFAEALGEAQRGGFAERDPSRDIEGWDTACKLLILANFGLDAGLELADVAVSGIDAVTPEQVARWQGEGRVPRLVGRLDLTGAKPAASVAVQTYPLDDAFAHIPGKTKALRVETDCMGEILTMGGGPEPMATASAALKDFELILERGL
ncbi:homoserine dehydrogenase, partial [Novosphingobium sp. 1949]|nr:homoserine dehydrogenase [Novosphingobium organovorum]